MDGDGRSGKVISSSSQEREGQPANIEIASLSAKHSMSKIGTMSSTSRNEQPSALHIQNQTGLQQIHESMTEEGKETESPTKKQNRRGGERSRSKTKE
mmetsp:Transcript_4655/g.7053  ORF Transcript_4655/g.7053 Transcript_4655/m.7053 type:complete len:98 (-) Transcript_4655:880-1173(-)